MYVPEEHSKNDRSIATILELTVTETLFASDLCKCFRAMQVNR